MELSCTSVMLPRWGLDETFDNLQSYGYDAVELRCRYNPDDPNVEPSFWGRHLSDVSPDNIVDKAPRIRAAAQRTGLRVAALAPNFVYSETEVIVKLFKGALAIDPDRPPLIRIGAPGHDRTRPYWPPVPRRPRRLCQPDRTGAHTRGQGDLRNPHRHNRRHRLAYARTAARPRPGPHRRHIRYSEHGRSGHRGYPHGPGPARPLPGPLPCRQPCARRLPVAPTPAISPGIGAAHAWERVWPTFPN